MILFMEVFMNKLLGLTIIFSIISAFGISAMEMPEHVREQREYEERLRQVEQERRQQREASQRQYQQQLREQRITPTYRSVQQRLNFENID